MTTGQHRPGYNAKYYAEHTKKQKEKDPEGFKQRQRERTLVFLKKRQEDPERRLKHNEETRIYQKEWRARIKAEIFDLLGGKCVKCGFTDRRALQIDHINGGGIKHFKAKGSSSALYREILRELKEGSEKYQLLCANCNWIKRYENGELLGI